MPAGKNKKKVFGKRKDELNGLILVAIVSLRAKVCAFIYLDKIGNITKEKTSKGTQRSAVKYNLCFNDYKRVLDTNTVIRKEQYRFKCHNLKISTEKLLRKL